MQLSGRHADRYGSDNLILTIGHTLHGCSATEVAGDVANKLGTPSLAFAYLSMWAWLVTNIPLEVPIRIAISHAQLV